MQNPRQLDEIYNNRIHHREFVSRLLLHLHSDIHNCLYLQQPLRIKIFFYENSLFLFFKITVFLSGLNLKRLTVCPENGVTLVNSVHVIPLFVDLQNCDEYVRAKIICSKHINLIFYFLNLNVLTFSSSHSIWLRYLEKVVVFLRKIIKK